MIVKAFLTLKNIYKFINSSIASNTNSNVILLFSHNQFQVFLDFFNEWATLISHLYIQDKVLNFIIQGIKIILA